MLIKSHGIKVGPGDVLTPVLIKTHLPVLLPHFVRLVNLSLSSCSTEGLNEAHVVPILKSLDLDSDSYRPVSLLSFVSLCLASPCLSFSSARTVGDRGMSSFL